MDIFFLRGAFIPAWATHGYVFHVFSRFHTQTLCPHSALLWSLSLLRTSSWAGTLDSGREWALTGVCLQARPLPSVSLCLPCTNLLPPLQIIFLLCLAFCSGLLFCVLLHNTVWSFKAAPGNPCQIPNSTWVSLSSAYIHAVSFIKMILCCYWPSICLILSPPQLISE